LRGADVSYNPVFVGHLLLDARTAKLFVADGKIDNGLRARLAGEWIDLATYRQAAAPLAALPPAATLLIDPRRVTLGMRQAVPAGVEVIEAINSATMGKARKTAQEIAHIPGKIE